MWKEKDSNEPKTEDERRGEEARMKEEETQPKNY